eukprot:jgi/Tetstr1/454946/TSEL_041807.t1
MKGHRASEKATGDLGPAAPNMNASMRGAALSPVEYGSLQRPSSVQPLRQHVAHSSRRPRSLVVRAMAAHEKRVVITGLGVVSSVGQTHEEFYNNLLAGKSGISQIEHFDTEGYPTTIAGEIKTIETEGFIDKKQSRRIDDCLKCTIVAGKSALNDAGLQWDGPELEKLDKERCGILIGSAMGGMDVFTNATAALLEKGHKKMNPFCIPFAITNMGPALLAMDVGFMGPNYSAATACATGNYCIHQAVEHIRRGDADLMLAGGSDAAVIPSGIGGFIACKALSKRNDEPEKASRPWDQGRDGFVMGEGAGVLVLESLEHALARGAPIYAEYMGGAMTCDAYNMTDPHPEGKGVRRCIGLALANAGLQPEEIDYVNAHGTSTQAGDLAEYRAITGALPHDSLRINSTKSMIGHLLGAAGAVEAVAAVKAIQTGKLHPNLNLDNPEEAVDLNILVGGQAQEKEVTYALSNSFGFGGHNSSIIFGKYQP